MLTNLFLGQTAEEKNFIEDLFSCYLYTGNGSTQTITNGIDLAGKGGLVWFKDRSTTDHALFDSARGAGKLLTTNNSNAEGSGYAQSFTSSGFSLTNGGSFYNGNGLSYASWTFRKAPKFFDVVTWSGDGTTGYRTLNHSLGTLPGMIIMKCTSTSNTPWYTYHRSLGTSKYLQLETTAAAGDVSAPDGWSVTDTTFGNHSSQFGYNTVGRTYVAYLFAHDTTADGVIQCGSYSGTGSSGNFISLGWEPQFVLIKRSSGFGDWFLHDNMRGMSNSRDAYLNPNLSDAETPQGSGVVIPSASGFSINATGTNWNASGSTYIYLAIRRGPMRVPTDATKVYKAITRSGTGAAASINTVGFPPDLILNSGRSGNCEFAWADKLRGRMVLRSAQTSSETDLSSFPSNDLVSYDQNGFSVGPDYNTQINQSVGGRTEVYECLRRAPGFFDVVCYTGTGSARTVSHNLGVAPELMIVKCRTDSTTTWVVYSKSIANTQYLNLSSGNPVATSTALWNSTSPTDTSFSAGAALSVNGSGQNYVAYLFASCPGVSKVSTYTGNGSSLNVDCGFSNGARFVLIKRTDSSSHWMVFDTARGIASGNDPVLRLNTTDAEINTLDVIDPLSTGFTIKQTTTHNANVSGGTYIYLAIA